MKNAAIGCGIVLAALLAMVGIWFLIASIAGTADDGPRAATYSTLNHRSTL